MSYIQNNIPCHEHLPDCLFAVFGPSSQVGCECNPQTAAQMEVMQELDLMAVIAEIPLDVFQSAPAHALPSPEEIEQMSIPDLIPLPTPPLPSPTANSHSGQIQYIAIPDTPELVATPPISPQIKWEDIPDKVYEDALAEMLLDVFRPEKSAPRSPSLDTSPLAPITGRALLKMMPEHVIQAAVVDILADVVQRKAPALVGTKPVEYIEVLDSPELGTVPPPPAPSNQVPAPRPCVSIPEPISGRAQHIPSKPVVAQPTLRSPGPIVPNSNARPIPSARQPEPRRVDQRNVAAPQANMYRPHYLVRGSVAGTKRKASPAPEECAPPPQKRIRVAVPNEPRTVHVHSTIPLPQNPGASGWQLPYTQPDTSFAFSQPNTSFAYTQSNTLLALGQPNTSFAYPSSAPFPAYDFLTAPTDIPPMPTVPSWQSDFNWRSGVPAAVARC